MGYVFVQALMMIFNVLETAIFILCILSWIAPHSRLYGVMDYFIEPFVKPFRPLGYWIREKTGVPLDFSLLFLIIAMRIAQTLIIRVYYAAAL